MPKGTNPAFPWIWFRVQSAHRPPVRREEMDSSLLLGCPGVPSNAPWPFTFLTHARRWEYKFFGTPLEPCNLRSRTMNENHLISGTNPIRRQRDLLTVDPGQSGACNHLRCNSDNPERSTQIVRCIRMCGRRNSVCWGYSIARKRQLRHDGRELAVISIRWGDGAGSSFDMNRLLYFCATVGAIIAPLQKDFD